MSTHASILPRIQAAYENIRQPRKGCLYTPEELAILRKHKAEYLKKTTHAERVLHLKTAIFVDIFNYWDAKGFPLEETDIRQRMKALCVWIWNNWRPHRTIKTAAATKRKVSYVDIVWNERQEEVLEEIHAILEKPDPTPQEIFMVRTRAASHVYRRLNEHERAIIKRKADTAEKFKNPPHIQQRRATKLGQGIVKKWAADQYNDLGMFCLTFYAYFNKDQKLMVGLDDHLAANANRAEKRFGIMYPELVKDLQRKLIDYVKVLTQPQTDITATATRTSTAAETLLETENGYPKVPHFLPEDKVTKDQAEGVMRRYLTAEYKLASAGRKRHVPFSMLEADTHRFIAARYLPPRMTLKDPRNMTKGEILNFMAHVDEREKRYGIQDGFRFHSYYNGTEMVPAEYPIDGEEPAEQAASMRAKKARAAKKSRKGKEKELAPPNHSDTDSREPDAAGYNSRQPDAAGHNTHHPDAAGHHTRQPDAAGHNTRHPIAAGTASDSNIDPSLLATDTVPPQSSEEENGPESSIRRIGGVEMAVLVKLGHPPVLPINGPSDGLPQYEVTSAAYHLFTSKLVSQRKEEVPRSRGRPRKTQKNAEDMVDSISTPAKNTRSRAISTPAKNTRSRANKQAEAVKKGTQSGPRRSSRQKK